ncbi:Uncharacterised protein [uncultured Clostridium sp.]|nr:Uncharacterised protein [uncultured Clostridium sp.]
MQSQIESWQSQMDWYNDQVEECTVYVSLSEVSTYSPPSEGFGSRFVSALSAGWQNFVSARPCGIILEQSARTAESTK